MCGLRKKKKTDITIVYYKKVFHIKYSQIHDDKYIFIEKNFFGITHINRRNFNQVRSF